MALVVVIDNISDKSDISCDYFYYKTSYTITQQFTAALSNEYHCLPERSFIMNKLLNARGKTVFLLYHLPLFILANIVIAVLPKMCFLVK